MLGRSGKNHTPVLPAGGGDASRMCSSRRSLRRDRRRRLHHQILGLLIERKGDDLADVRRVGQQHDDAVDARGRAAMRRRAEAERVQQAAEPRLDLGRG